MGRIPREPPPARQPALLHRRALALRHRLHRRAAHGRRDRGGGRAALPRPVRAVARQRLRARGATVELHGRHQRRRGCARALPALQYRSAAGLSFRAAQRVRGCAGRLRARNASRDRSQCISSPAARRCGRSKTHDRRAPTNTPASTAPAAPASRARRWSTSAAAARLSSSREPPASWVMRPCMRATCGARPRKRSTTSRRCCRPFPAELHRTDALDCTIYLRHAGDLAAVREVFERHVGTSSHSVREAAYVRADICRADLLVEIEAQSIVRRGVRA